jgi:site-specific recombinase XerD
MKRKKNDRLYLRGRVWWMNFTENGRPHQRSTGTEDLTLAEITLAKVKVAIHEGRWFDMDQARKHTFNEMMDRFMKEHAPTVSEKMQKSYKNSLAHLSDFFSGKRLGEIDPDLIMKYVVHRREQTSRPGTRNRELAMLSKAFNLARLWKLTKENPCELVHREAEDNEHVGQCLPEEKEQALMWLCKPLCNGQLVDMVIVALHTGLRESEVLGMRWDKVNFTARSITVIQKGNSVKVCAMNDTVFNVLIEKSKVRSISGYVFVTANDTPFIPRNMYREFKKVCRKIGLPTFRFHDLRHTVGTRLAQSGYDIYAIASVLGHSQLSTTKRYARHNVESLRHVVNSLDKKEAVNG